MKAGSMLSRARSLPARLVAVLAVALALAVSPAIAGDRLGDFIGKVGLGDLVPGADRLAAPQPLSAGLPPVAAAYAGDRLVGHVFLNSDFVNATGYSGKPIHVLVGLDRDGVITGARLVDHHEPIVLIGIPEAKVAHFIQGYVGSRVTDLVAAARQGPPVDIISGATVSVVVIGDSIVRSALKVQQGLKAGGAAGAVARTRKTIDPDRDQRADWATLVGDGSVRRLTLTVAEVNDAFRRTGNAIAAERPEPGDPGDTFIDLHVALVSVPSIGRSLLGDAEYQDMAGRLKPGQQAVLIAADGRYSFKGSGYVRGGIFDRVELVQGDDGIRFHDRDHKRLGGLAAVGAPALREIGLFRLPDGQAFDPAEPWRLNLLVQRATGALDKAFTSFAVGYATPDPYLRTEPAPPLAAVAVADPVADPVTGPVAAAAAGDDVAAVPLWRRMWQGRVLDIAILATALLALTGIFFFQMWFARRPVLFGRVRVGFLIFALVWLGWHAHAQLSVVNVLAFVNALMTDFQWDYFLMDPLVFILWSAVAVALLFWGRGAFCGWLCPFGALQELTNRLARRLGVRQVRVPWGLHERLWPIKYILFLGLFGLSLSSLALAERLAEIEPFKTAIILHFLRDGPFTLFAVALLAAGLFIERFFCRYLCPLGAALAIPARLRMFDWLRRYRDCGNPCQRCANECMVGAIHPEGHINPNECLSCLHCQTLYVDDRRCPVVIKRRERTERRQGTASPEVAAPAAPPVRRTTLSGSAPERPSPGA